MQTNGFSFIEFTGTDEQELDALFRGLGLTKTAQHKTKEISLYEQGHIRFFMNLEQDSFAAGYARKHGPAVCGMAINVENSEAALQVALDRNAKESNSDHPIPSIEGVGQSQVYLCEEAQFQEYIESSFDPVSMPSNDVGLTHVDHLANNVFTGNGKKAAAFYKDVLGFKSITSFNIKGKVTGLKSEAIVSSCGKMRMTVNESSDAISQISEFLKDFNGEGVQHIALIGPDIYESMEKLLGNGVPFVGADEEYYKELENRLPKHGEDSTNMRLHKVLLDGIVDDRNGNQILLQSFTKRVFGAFFMEIMQRKGHDGFGEGNFTAGFKAIEQDQIERGNLRA
ncbi:MAG: 4-hydroxyphenylpyruvate dioxygenase [Alphaproteobacteria bacterium]|jgi:4-hydroxyphenylpyruvate dioxygenase|nr:4-hydroxyphenylpyruvate dioxygenase [Alphaproteobacteria bacterium]MBT5389825.1 4-hydroxyphenylpyruvate dioxygenase [Alphaproteobacteria bacterium]MBT5654378.1 4-hydroxyphenylpyruvate dioxygenase [Alphaproteobacteria bacterium]